MGDVVIRGGTVIDGSGARGVRADVRVSDGRIAEIATALRPAGADEVLEADGCVVAPGFIDIHTHYDAQVFWDPALTPSSWHGVTTVVAGNCGFSVAPLRREHRETMIETLRHVEDMHSPTLAAGVAWDEFETYPQYLSAVAERGVRLNFGGYVGHTAVRLYVLGDEAFERGATQMEIAAMAQIVREAMLAGALGFSTSSVSSHVGAGGRPVPSRLADLAEMLALVEPLRDLGRGVVSMVVGDKIGYADTFTVQRHAQRPLTWTPVLVMAGFDHDHWIDEIACARADGHDIWGQTAARPVVFQENLREPFTLQRYPAFASLTGKDDAARVAAYRDPVWRARAAAEMAEPDRAMAWANVSVSESPQPHLVGRGLVGIADERATTPLDVLVDVAIEDGLATRFSVAVANADAFETSKLIRAEGVLIGLADSGAHVGQLCDACFATDLLATWVRTRHVLTIEQAVHKLTGVPAQFLGLTDRGRIAAGFAADICVFDPETVAPGPLRRVRDFPADGERLVADAPVGVRHVLVNGVPVRREGVDAEAHVLPGAVLRSTVAASANAQKGTNHA